MLLVGGRNRLKRVKKKKVKDKEKKRKGPMISRQHKNKEKLRTNIYNFHQTGCSKCFHTHSCIHLTIPAPS